jgi:hypothetical protein
LVVRLEHPIKEELAHFAGKLGKSGKAG